MLSDGLVDLHAGNKSGDLEFSQQDICELDHTMFLHQGGMPKCLGPRGMQRANHHNLSRGNS